MPSLQRIHQCQEVQVENILLFEIYIQECQRTFRKAFVNQTCTPLKDVPQSKGVASSMIHLHKFMTNNLYGEINELYLFHGTKINTVDVILQQGLDDRLASPLWIVVHPLVVYMFDSRKLF
jgi:hypothetical protein